MPTVSVIKPTPKPDPDPQHFAEIGRGTYKGVVVLLSVVGRTVRAFQLANTGIYWEYESLAEAIVNLDLQPLPPGTEIKITV